MRPMADARVVARLNPTWDVEPGGGEPLAVNVVIAAELVGVSCATIDGEILTGAFLYTTSGPSP